MAPDDSASIVPPPTSYGPPGEAASANWDAGMDLGALLGPPRDPGELGRLGGYRILRLLGRGGMGAVFAAEDTALGRTVAVKVLLPAAAASTIARHRFAREARAAAAVVHDHLVPIYHVGEERGAPFLVMPLLTGESLDDRLRAVRPLPWADVARIGRAVADGLAAAHAAGLVHRDIKPANVWLERAPDGAPGRVRVLDFGLARATDGTDGLTLPGHVIGTPAYMSPEQARGVPVDARSDLFSLGAVLYQAATGRLPFAGDTCQAVLSAVAGATPARADLVNPAVPRTLADLIHRLLAKDPNHRPGGAREVADELARLPAAG